MSTSDKKTSFNGAPTIKYSADGRWGREDIWVFRWGMAMISCMSKNKQCENHEKWNHYKSGSQKSIARCLLTRTVKCQVALLRSSIIIFFSNFTKQFSKALWEEFKNYSSVPCRFKVHFQRLFSSTKSFAIFNLISIQKRRYPICSMTKATVKVNTFEFIQLSSRALFEKIHSNSFHLLSSDKSHFPTIIFYRLGNKKYRQ